MEKRILVEKRKKQNVAIKAITLILLLLSCFVFGFAFVGCKEKDRDYTLSVDDGDVAELTLFAFDGKNESKWGLFNLGHCFLSLKNTSGGTLDLYNYELKSGETVAFGTWSILSHFGVWFNVEGNYVDAKNKYDGRVSITIGISAEDVEKLSDFIVANDRWDPYRNCSYFALNCWNEVAVDTEKIDKPAILYTPGYIGGVIKKFEGYEENKEIKTDNTMGYYNGIHYIEYEMEGAREDF